MMRSNADRAEERAEDAAPTDGMVGGVDSGTAVSKASDEVTLLAALTEAQQDMSPGQRWHLSGRALESAEPDGRVVVDLRFGDPTIEVDREPTARSTDRAIPPVVDAESVIRRHIGGTRLAAAVTRRKIQRASRSAYFRAKRVVDVTTAFVLVALLLPVWAIVAVAIRLSSPGPVLYRQPRHGRGSREFGILKFRTMVNGADSMIDEMEDLVARGEVEALDEVVFKAYDDPRITRVGRLLRRTNLDETPQLLNVIAGTMSLVGPRPLVTAEIEALSDRVRDIRHSVTPGITCLWQVSRREDTTFAERMALDLLYVQQRSLRLDSYLLAMTPRSILRGVRSY
jgi:lipopolysaccharide/colanic/teichoic acid biosynthesis glycosyltransferase